MGDPELFERLFHEVGAWAGPKGLMQRPDMEAISVYHDDPEAIPVEKQRISVGFTVPLGTPAEGDIQMLEMPEGDYVVGAFEILPAEYGACWGEIMDYMEKERIRPTGLMYESYKNDPSQHPEGKHQVDICIAV
jgi:AraC family transcriptional regulator